MGTWFRLLWLVLLTAPAIAGDVLLEWQPPTENTDGTELTDLAGFKVYRRPEAGSYVQVLELTDPAATSATVTVPDGELSYLAMTALDAEGTESTYSNEICRQPDGTPCEDPAPPVVEPGAASVALSWRFGTDGGSSVVDATGGTKTTPGDGYVYHTFTADGTLTVNTGGQVDILVVGGGGGGTAFEYGGAGGGGAGGAIVENGYSLSSGSYGITIGAGGAGAASQTSATKPARENGENTTFGALFTAVGGGAGGQSDFDGTASPGADGGSGGGGCGEDVGSAGGAGTAGQGNSGGAASSDLNSTDRTGGGGGGAGSAGVDGQTVIGGDGGDGIEWPAGSGDYYAGGGGGGAHISSASVGAGGLGGGGAGGKDSSAPTNGAANTGGGGGGAGGNIGVAGDGGSGIVIIRYSLSAAGQSASVWNPRRQIAQLLHH